MRDKLAAMKDLEMEAGLMTKQLLQTTLILLLAGFLASCSFSYRTVEVWERENLAKAEMQFSKDILSSLLHKQIHESKEAASGDSNAAGTGCGCN